MTFLNPWMLLGAFAAGIPIALHFFYRSRYRPVPWAAMKFLRLSIEQTSRRLRFQELVLLILRALVCLILAFALARPASKSLTAGSGRGESVDAIIVIDNSYSMSANDTETLTRLDRAKEAATKIIENLPPRSTVQIIACSDKAANLGPHSPSNLDQARFLVKNLKTCSLSTDFEAGFREAVACFDRTTGASKEVYLISDMQRSGWERQATAIRAKCEEIKNQASLYLVRCGDKNKALQNVAVIGISPQTEIPCKGSAVAFTVFLRNSGSAAVENINLSLTVDGQKKFSRDTVAVNRVEAGETKAITIYGKFENPGWRIITARINEKAETKEESKKDDAGKDEGGRNRSNQDAIKEDDEFSRILYVHEKVRVLIVDGTPNNGDPSLAGSFYVANVLLPVSEEKRSAYHVTLTAIPAEAASAISLADRDICVLTNVAANQLRADFTQELDRFVRSGKGLFIATGHQVVGSQYNATFGKLLPAPLANSKPVLAAKEHFAPNLASVDVYSFLVKAKEKGNHPLQKLDSAFTAAITPVEDPTNATDKNDAGRVLLRFNNGLPMLLSKNVGNGEVMLLTTSVDNTWSHLCELPAFLPFMHGCLAQMLERSAAVYNLVAGEQLRWPPPDRQKDYYVVPPDGERVFLGKAKDYNGEMRLPVFDTSTAGVYHIEAEDGTSGARFVFVPDLRESENLDTLSDEQIDEQLGFQPVHLKTGFEGSAFTGAERSRNEWTTWVLAALLLFALGETLWAWFCGRAW
jgi:Aerotolerance regulator N-terminal/von Willebrand factor type A domain/CARDB